jgi:CxxC-x17-CxxC domain-containing protein
MSTTIFEDRTLTCSDCQKPFVWTAGEQRFFKDKGLEHEPKRCKPCKKTRKDRIEAAQAQQQSGEPRKVEFSAICADCKEPTVVPFYPLQGRPVYCRPCFKGRQSS